MTHADEAFASAYMTEMRDRSPLTDLLFTKRDWRALGERIGRDVAKLRSCSKAGRAMIAQQRCEAVGIWKDGKARFKLRTDDRLAYTPLDENGRLPRYKPEPRTVSWTITHELQWPKL
jgi:hypothetical protein